jgi:two-component system, LuxR family, response regulator FixJ
MTADRTVHVVDDDAAVRRSLERLLHSASHACVSYPTPAAFLDAARELPGGCILLDVRMPGMDGLELQDRLNQLGVTLPVIVMTGQGDVQTAVQAMKAGAVDFIEKPFDEEAAGRHRGGAGAGGPAGPGSRGHRGCSPDRGAQSA